MVMYHLPVPATMPAIPVRGRFLAHNHYDRIGRAFLAADLVTGVTVLVKPTLVQAAFLAGVNRNYAGWAVKRLANRAEIENGLTPLVPASPGSNGDGHLVPDDVSLFDFVRAVGVEKILNVASAVEQAAHQ